MFLIRSVSIRFGHQPTPIKTLCAKMSKAAMKLNPDNPNLAKVSDVDIDKEGRFKYILIKLIDQEAKEFKYIVRGYGKCSYHGDIFELVEPSFISRKLDSFCTGGGRIIHDPKQKFIQVFGHSTGYGKADHSISSDILRKCYPDYKVEWNDEGY